MPNRYEDILAKINQNNKRVLKPSLYPPIARSNKDIYIITTPGDRLDLLASKYYGDVSYWWIIAQANNLGKGTLSVPPAIQLRIPKDLSQISADYKKLNN